MHGPLIILSTCIFAKIKTKKQQQKSTDLNQMHYHLYKADQGYANKRRQDEKIKRRTGPCSQMSCSFMHGFDLASFSRYFLRSESILS